MRKLLWASLIVLFIAAAVGHSAGQESTAETNKAVVKRAFAALNEGDLKTLNELYPLFDFGSELEIRYPASIRAALLTAASLLFQYVR
jgi:hypothetical protein